MEQKEMGHRCNELWEELSEAANNLLKLPSSTDAILSLLDKTESLLSNVGQNPTVSEKRALMPSKKALVSANLLRNPDSDVRVSVISCLAEFMRINAPDAPCNDGQMKEIFQVTIEAFGKLANPSCRSYMKAKTVLETVSKVRSFLVMLDLKCNDLILEMFRQFLKIISPDHPRAVLRAMENIMITVIKETEEVSMDLLEILLTTVEKERKDVSQTASELVKKVLSTCACKLQPHIMEALKSTGTSLDMYFPVVSSMGKPATVANVLSLPSSNKAAKGSHKRTKKSEQTPKSRPARKQTAVVELEPNTNDRGHELVGKRLKVWWPLDKEFYEGVIDSYNSHKKMHKVSYSDGDIEELCLKNERFEIIQDNFLANEDKLDLGQTKSTDAETEEGSSSPRNRGQNCNTLMNPEESSSSPSKEVQEKELGDSSLGNHVVQKASLCTKPGQTNLSVVLYLPSSSKAEKEGSRKRTQTDIEDTDQDVGSFPTPTPKKQMVKKSNPEEEDFVDSELEKPEDGTKSSKKERAKNGLAKTFAKKQMVKKNTPEVEDLMDYELEKPEDGTKTATETNMVNTSGKKSVNSDSKTKNSEDASTDTTISRSSKSKKKNSRAMAPTKKSEQTPKSRPTRKETAVVELESNTNDRGHENLPNDHKMSRRKRKEVIQENVTSLTSIKKLNVNWSDAEKFLYESLKKMKLKPTRYMDEEVLEELKLLDDVKKFFDAIGWSQFIRMRYPTYQDITLEFLATLNVSYPNGINKASQGLVSFKLGTTEHTISIKDVCHIFGFPEDKEDVKFKEDKEFRTSTKEILWKKIATSECDSFKSQMAKMSHVRNPVIRYALGMMHYSFFAGSKIGVVSNDKLAIIFQALKKKFYLETDIWNCTKLVNDGLGDTINYGALLINQLLNLKKQAEKQPEKSSEKTIDIGGIISPIAVFCEVDLSPLQTVKGTMSIDMMALKKQLFISFETEKGIFYQYNYMDVSCKSVKSVRCLLPQEELTNLENQANWGFQPTEKQRKDPVEAEANNKDKTSDILAFKPMVISEDEDRLLLCAPQPSGFQANGNFQSYVSSKMEEHTRLIKEIITWKDLFMPSPDTSSGTHGLQTIEGQTKKRKKKGESNEGSGKKADLGSTGQTIGVETSNNLVGDSSLTGLEIWEKEFSSTNVIEKMEEHTNLLKKIIRKMNPSRQVLQRRKQSDESVRALSSKKGPLH